VEEQTKILNNEILDNKKKTIIIISFLLEKVQNKLKNEDKTKGNSLNLLNNETALFFVFSHPILFRNNSDEESDSDPTILSS